MHKPWYVEITRGMLVECRHLIHGIVMSADGNSMLEFGDADRATYPRSAVKWIQALELVLSGTADELALTDEQLALACSSHNGEHEHVSRVTAWLHQLNLTIDDLECGVSPPFTEAVRLQLVQKSQLATQVHHCCSGKHSGMLSICRHLGLPTNGYTDYHHPLQQRIRNQLGRVFDCDVNSLSFALDGCSVPTYAMPLHSLAMGFSRIGAARFDRDLNHAGRRLLEAQTQHPFLIAGSNRLDSALLKAGQGRLQIKMGADGVYCGAIPDRGLGFALKCEDGSLRGQEMAVIELLKAIDETKIISRLPDYHRTQKIKTARGAIVGSVSVNRNELS